MIIPASEEYLESLEPIPLKARTLQIFICGEVL